MRRVWLSGGFGTERAHRSGLPRVPLSRLRQVVQRAEWWLSEPSDGIALVVLWRLRYKRLPCVNNRLEQDHRGVRGRYGPMRGF
jgi:hypothetical protein